MNEWFEPSSLFTLANLAVIACWLFVFAGVFASRARHIAMILGRLLVPVLLGLLYAWLLFLGSQDSEGSMRSLDGVQRLFDNDQLLLAGWIHYLIFDLFIGLWVLEDSLKWRLHWAGLLPILMLCLMIGPIGLMAYVLLRLLLARQGSETRVQG